MEKLKGLFQTLKSWQKMVIAAVILAVITSVSLYYTLPDNYVAVYKNLNDKDKQDILAEMSKLGVDYKIEKDGSLAVAKKDAAWVRKQMTEMGLPSNSTPGDDILLQNSLGSSEQDKKLREQVGIRKQLEQDIVRNFNMIESANVQITLPEKESIFDNQAQKGTAAVTVGIQRNQSLTPDQILGIQYMVSAAVPGVKAEDVSVIDSKKGIISKADSNATASGSSSYEKELALQKQIEDKLKGDIESTLINILHINNFQVNTNVSVNYDEVTQQIEKYGDKGVLRSKQEQKDKSTAVDGSGKTEAGVASNGIVPGYNANSNQNGNTVYNQDNQANTENYEIDKTVETIKRHPELRKTNIVVWVDEKTLLQQNMDVNTFKQAIATAAGLQANPDGTFANGQVNIVTAQLGQKDTKPTTKETPSSGINWLLIAGIAVPLLLLIGAGIYFLVRRKKKEEEAFIEDIQEQEPEQELEQEPVESELAATTVEEEEEDEDYIPLDEQVKQVAQLNINETAKVLKKWLKE
ncbi:flagellar basal-body MS-ring/collar protein FliF [Microbacteriaceae bacterium 4G12]